MVDIFKISFEFNYFKNWKQCWNFTHLSYLSESQAIILLWGPISRQQRQDSRANSANRASCCAAGCSLVALPDDAVGQWRRPAQPLPLHFKAAAFVLGHAPAVHLHVRLKDLPDPLLGLELLVWFTCGHRGGGSALFRLSREPSKNNSNCFCFQISANQLSLMFLVSLFSF